MQKSRLKQYGMMVAAGAGLTAAGNVAATPVGTTDVNIDIASSPYGGFNFTRLDFDGNGTDDISFFQSYAVAVLGVVTGGPNTGGGVAIVEAGNYNAVDLAPGDIIDDSLSFATGVIQADSPYYTGTFNFDDGGILGVSFLIDSNLHFGWVELSAIDPLATPSTPVGQIIGFGYNTVAGEAISAGDIGTGLAPDVPEPSSLALLALGAVGIISRRNKKSV